MSRKFDKLLNDCLENNPRTDEEIGRCVGEHPDDAGGLIPLLKTSALLKTKLAHVQPRPIFRSLAKQRFFVEAGFSGKRKKDIFRLASFRGRHPWVVLAASMLIIFLVGGSTTVAASNNSMPDDFLYRVKIATEHVRFALAGSEINKAEIIANFADRRINEIAQMARDGKTGKVKDAAERFTGHFDKIGHFATGLKARGAISESEISGLRDRLLRFIGDHPGVLQRSHEHSPRDARMALEQVMQMSQKRYVSALQNVNIATRLSKEQRLISGIRNKIIRGIIYMITDDQWSINDEVVNLDDNSIILGDLQTGRMALAETLIQPDGSLLATKIIPSPPSPSSKPPSGPGSLGRR